MLRTSLAPTGIGGGAIIAPFCVALFHLPVYMKSRTEVHSGKTTQFKKNPRNQWFLSYSI